MMRSFLSVARCPLLCLLSLGILPIPPAVASSIDNIGQEASQYFASRAEPAASPDPWLNNAVNPRTVGNVDVLDDTQFL
jgi:hypothetical protein